MNIGKTNGYAFGTGFRFVDLFSGLGGFRIALESLGGKCAMSSEIEPHARTTYYMNFNDWPRGDIREINDKDIPEHDILCGGFPCQSFSIAGKKLGFEDETRGTLFYEIIRFLKARKPAVAFLENVVHLLNHEGGRTFAIIKHALEESGYVVFHQVLNASLYGSPTARKRVYIVAFRSDLGIHDFAFPEPTFTPVKLADVLLPECQTACYVVRNHEFHPDHAKQEIAARAHGRASLKTLSVGHIGDRKPAKQGYRVYSHMGQAVTFLARGGGVGAQTGLYPPLSASAQSVIKSVINLMVENTRFATCLLSACYMEPTIRIERTTCSLRMS